MSHVIETLILWWGYFGNWYTYVYLDAYETTFFSDLLFWVVQFRTIPPA